MPEIVEPPGVDLPLRERIDQLATRLILDGVSRELAADLARLSEVAAGTGCPETARLATELADNLRAAEKRKKKKALLHDLLRDGIAQLQQALDNDAYHASPAAAGPAQAEPEPLTVNSLAQDPQLVGDFVLESREHLASIESGMLTLEQNPADAEALHSVFRGFHTIKGLAGFLELTAIQEVAHEVETLLDLARNAKLLITPSAVDVVLASSDYLKQAVQAVEAATAGGTPRAITDQRPLLSRLRTLTEGAPAEVESDTREIVAEEVAALPGEETSVAVEPPGPVPTVPKEPASSSPPSKAVNKVSVRVETAKLDYLMDMVGEMVIAQSLVRHNPSLASLQDSRLQGDLSQLARITNEVQRTAMGMRMIPIGQLFQRTARLVRDLARKAGKPVELITSGEDTELDKTIAEELADPLMHMVRNAIDHGIEEAEIRVAAGKSPTARVRLAAYHQSGHIVIQISDDGRGLDRDKILRKARQNGLIDATAQPSENEILHLIFEPGFSTADQVTDISGRGVGMDVVRRHVQKLRGRIDIQSKAGQGTTFFLKLPLTLAIIEGLVVVVGASRYIVPIFSVREMIRPVPESLTTVQGRGEMALVRGRLLPVVRLYRRFGVRPRSEDPCEGLLVVAECEGRQLCVLVDDLVGKQEVVIKSLGEGLKNIAGIAGGAILGDGRVGLLLDMEGVFRGTSGE